MPNCFYSLIIICPGSSWPWWYGGWIYNYICNQCLSSLMWVRISIKARCTALCDKVCQRLATGRWFFPGPPVSSTNETVRHDLTEILLKVALNTIKLNQTILCPIFYTQFLSHFCQLLYLIELLYDQILLQLPNCLMHNCFPDFLHDFVFNLHIAYMYFNFFFFFFFLS